MTPQFNSQLSHTMLNVSEDHSSSAAQSSPAAAAKQTGMTLVEQSPTFSQNNQVGPTAFDTADLVEDSLPRDVASYQRYQVDADDEEDLYCVSPKGKAKLDATREMMSSHKEMVGLVDAVIRYGQADSHKPAALPKRNLLDLFLEEGAVAAAPVVKNDIMVETYATGNPGLPAITKIAKPRATDLKRKSDGDPSVSGTRGPAGLSTGDGGSGHPDSSIRAAQQVDEGNVTKSKNNKKINTKKTTTQIPEDVPDQRSLRTTSPQPRRDGKITGREVIPKASIQDEAPQINNPATLNPNDVTARQAALAKSATSEQSQHQKSDNRVRPQRQAKKTALDKLRAKRNEGDSDHDDDLVDGGQAAISHTKEQKISGKVVSKGGGSSKQLPTPITNGNISHSTARPSQGKLKSLKLMPTSGTQNRANVKQSTDLKTNATRGSGGNKRQKVSSSPEAPSEHAAGQPSLQDGTEASEHDETDPKIHARRESRESMQADKRPGTLKRPAKFQSSGRQGVQAAAPALSRAASPKGKRRRKLAKASKTPPVKPGATRQKMQSVSVKERVDNSKRVNNSRKSAQLPSCLDTISLAATKAVGPSKDQNLTKRNKEVVESPGSKTKQSSQHCGDSSAQLIPAPIDNVKVQSKVESRSANLDPKVGSSQANAIMIEQDAESSSSSCPSPSPNPPNDVAQMNANISVGPSRQIAASRPQTPAMLPSSPPVSETNICHPFPSDKPTIIAFGKQGPRNQGATPGRKRGFTPHRPLLEYGEASRTKFAAKPRSFTELIHGEDGHQLVVNHDFEGTTLINDENVSTEQPTASQITMPPPDKKSKRLIKSAKVDDDPTEPSDVLVKRMLKPSTTVSTHATVHVNDVPTATATSDAASTRSVLRKSVPTKSANTAEKTGATQRAQIKRKRERDADPERGSMSKEVRPFQTGTQVFPQATVLSAGPAVSQVDPIKRAERRRSRPSRRTTEAFPGVDILGSPYPRDLQVPIQATALEVFMHHAGLSDDTFQNSDEDAVPKLKFTAIPTIAPGVDRELVLSNEKPVPAAPQESSKAVSRIASGPLAQDFLTADRARPRDSDPFTRSPEHVTVSEHDDPKLAFERIIRQNQTVDARKSTEADHEQHDYDGDTTLVQEDESEGEASPSNADDSPAAIKANAASEVLKDVGDWRHTLKPHQTHLFDSLVVASHTLVQHIVDSETAQNDIVADYYRRGDIIVKKLQKTHASEYQRYQQNMQAWKKRAADELAAQGTELRKKMKDGERAKAELRKAKRDWGEVEEAFGELLAGLS